MAQRGTCLCRAENQPLGLLVFVIDKIGLLYKHLCDHKMDKTTENLVKGCLVVRSLFSKDFLSVSVLTAFTKMEKSRL